MENLSNFQNLQRDKGKRVFVKVKFSEFEKYLGLKYIVEIVLGENKL